GDTSTAPPGTSSPDNYVWIGPITGSWDLAGNWKDTTAGLNPASVAPGSNDLVTINAAAGNTEQVITGTGASASLTINGGSTSLLGNFTTGALVDNGLLTVNTGSELMVAGNATIKSTLFVDGTLTTGSLNTTLSPSIGVISGTLTTGSLTTSFSSF